MQQIFIEHKKVSILFLEIYRKLLKYFDHPHKKIS